METLLNNFAVTKRTNSAKFIPFPIFNAFVGIIIDIHFKVRFGSKIVKCL